MTIQLLKPFNGLSPGIYSNLGAVEEARLIALPGGMARDYTPGMDGSNPVFSNAQQSGLQALVLGGGIGVLNITAPDGYDVGDTLTATPVSGWTISGYQWTRDGVDIAGATSSTYVLTLADVQMPHLPPKIIGCRAVSAVYSALSTLPTSTAFPAGYLSLDNGALSLDGALLSLV